MSPGVLFVVQGEGRGHLTQALALKKQLDIHQIPLVGMVVGQNSQRDLPSYFTEKIQAPLFRLPSPNFVYDQQKKGIDMLGSAKSWIKNFRAFKTAAHDLKKITDELQPALIINFFEPLVPISILSAKMKVPVFSVAHQYVFEHSAYIFPEGRFAEKRMIRAYTRFTGYGSLHKYALSLYPLPDRKKQKIKVIPPLLRNELNKVAVSNEDFVLAYVLNEGYIGELIAFKEKYPQLEIHCFTDKKGLTAPEEIRPGFYLHPLNDVTFLDMMGRCKILLTTAGFESIAESMYLRKPVLCVPVKGHYEQFCNSRDVVRAEAGGFSDTFEPEGIPRILERYEENEKFILWYRSRKHALIQDILLHVRNQ